MSGTVTALDFRIKKLVHEWYGRHTRVFEMVEYVRE